MGSKAEKHAECLYRDLRQDEMNHLRYRAYLDRLIKAAASGDMEAKEKLNSVLANQEEGLMMLSDTQKVLLGVD